MLFKQFDVDDSGYITIDNLKDAFIKLGKKVTFDEIKAIMKEHDVKGDNRLSY